MMDKRIFEEYLPENAIILDAGAFNGSDSIDFAKMFSKGIIYAIEPVTSIYNGLVENTKTFDNIKTFNVALDDECGEKEIFISSGYSVQSSSLLKPKEHLTSFPDCKFESSEIIKTTTINQFVKDNKIDHIDLMWLDLQGNEHKVLQQATDILIKTNYIYAEYSLKEFYQDTLLFDDFNTFMQSIGFEMIYNFKTYNNLGCGNALYKRFKTDNIKQERQPQQIKPEHKPEPVKPVSKRGRKKKSK
jgi:FkbM family methyltransferase